MLTAYAIVNKWTFRWSLIAGRLPGRTDNEVKNYWNSHLRKKLISTGIDPNNHKLGRFVLRCNQTHSGSTKEEACDDNNNNNTCNSVCEDHTSHKVSAAGIVGAADDKSSVEEDETSGNEAISSSSRGGGLNLDLTIGVPSQGVIEGDYKDDQTNIEVIITAEKEIEGVSHPTLLLFT